MKNIKGIFFLTLFILSGERALAYSHQELQRLIADVSKLYHGLPVNDGNLPLLNLRLADLNFEYSLALETENALGKPEMEEKAQRAHSKAIELYQLALSGHGGKFPAPQGNKALKIHFQLGRLYQRNLDMPKAVHHYQVIVKNPDTDSALKREAILNLAEYFEETQGPAQGEKYYDQALEVCDSTETCSYIHYRRAWTYFRQQKLAQAIVEIEQGLYDGQGKMKEQALKDYLVFLAETEGDGAEAFNKIEQISLKWKRPELLAELMEAFFAAGNRRAGTYALIILNNRNPSTFYRVRLLEELYGFERWSEMQEELTALKEQAQLPTDEKEIKAVHTILQRFILQLDGERKTRPEASVSLAKSIDLFLQFFPNDESRDKMIEGYLAATSSESEREQKLQIFIAQEMAAKRVPLEIKWRLKRLALAQTQKAHEVVMSESHALAKLHQDKPAEERKFSYLEARALYELKRYEEAFPLFQKLAVPSKSPDEWAIKSQNLVLDILNLQKKYDQVASVAQTWTENAQLKSQSELKDELSEMKKIENEASFAHAVSLGESAQALALFKTFCEQKIYAEKSCANAQVLAVKLGAQTELISILEKSGKYEELASELELMGQFDRAGKIMQEQTLKSKNFDLPSQLKMVLMFELGQKKDEQRQALGQMVQALSKQKSLPVDHQEALYQTFKDADYLSADLLKVPWNEAYRGRLVHDLDVLGRAPKNVAQIYDQAAASLGPKWALYQVEKAQKLDQKQRSLTFYGQRSEERFKRRVRELKQYVDSTKVVVERADTPTRLVLLTLLGQSYEDLAREIESTPVPEGMTEEQTAQIKNALATMAAPFTDEAKVFAALKNEVLAAADASTPQVAGLNAQNARDYFQKELELYREKLAAKPLPKAELLRPHLLVLAKEPQNTQALKEIQQVFAQSGHERPAAYFKGRLQQTSQGPTL